MTVLRRSIERRHGASLVFEELQSYLVVDVVVDDELARSREKELELRPLSFGVLHPLLLRHEQRRR